jgi:hypothetical protein
VANPAAYSNIFSGCTREAEGYFGRAVKNFDYVGAKQATELAFAPLAGCKFNAAVARPTFGAGGIGFYHDREWSLSRMNAQRRSSGVSSLAALYFP